MPLNSNEAYLSTLNSSPKYPPSVAPHQKEMYDGGKIKVEKDPVLADYG